ncbi:MAG: RNA-binding S4 domain-containing protein [Muribaculaceae bacterium]|nr:RNA-binding S4 domain-containing protein [Bacteroides sp.]MBD5420516.1 RNA-binding S4 domain-containing protein [Bacteroides sp.]MDE6193558.1 RNA-binding S4 domain-containing protein [Muribaculaceae bacterium]
MEVRIDKWLWAMRVFKTRTIATDACKKGRVMMGGAPVKPSRTIKEGDVVEVRKPPITYTFRVKATTQNRLGAKLVPDYLENITPQSQYDLLEMTKISGFVDRRKGLGRPTKRDSREMSRFKEDTYADTYFLDWEDDDDDEESDD